MCICIYVCNQIMERIVAMDSCFCGDLHEHVLSREGMPDTETAKGFVGHI